MFMGDSGRLSGSHVETSGGGGGASHDHQTNRKRPQDKHQARDSARPTAAAAAKGIVPPKANSGDTETERTDRGSWKHGPLKAATTLLRRAARAEAGAEGGPPADGGFVEG